LTLYKNSELTEKIIVDDDDDYDDDDDDDEITNKQKSVGVGE